MTFLRGKDGRRHVSSPPDRRRRLPRPVVCFLVRLQQTNGCPGQESNLQNHRFERRTYAIPSPGHITSHHYHTLELSCTCPRRGPTCCASSCSNAVAPACRRPSSYWSFSFALLFSAWLVFVRPAGLEPCDPVIKSHVLYRLSYKRFLFAGQPGFEPG